MEEDEAESEQVVSINEFIQGVEAQQLEADLVLGGDEGKECTYEKGYMKRQAVFSCLTCTPAGNAGFCTACSLTCHDGHEVVELWTRRGFRCDCGNEKFGSFECKLCKDKDQLNKDNVYNQNYGGVYCTCHRPYPDPEGADQGEMLQCCICEDWFHETHLGLPPSLQVPRDEEGEPTFDELICQSCVQRCSFLSKYPELLIPPIDSEDGDESLLTEIPEPSPLVAKKECGIEEVALPSGTSVDTNGPVSAKSDLESDLELPTPKVEAKAENGTFDSLSMRVMGESSGSGLALCKLNQPNKSAILHLNSGDGDEGLTGVKGPEVGRAVFLAKSWRAQLCDCKDCRGLYTTKGVEFLLEKEDTLQEYEETAKRKRVENAEKEEGTQRAFLQKLGHVQCIELVHGIKDMASELETFLTPFGETGKTVTSDDIYEFFEKLRKKKRRVIN